MKIERIKPPKLTSVALILVEQMGSAVADIESFGGSRTSPKMSTIVCTVSVSFNKFLCADLALGANGQTVFEPWLIGRPRKLRKLTPHKNYPPYGI